jgi:uncharacterized protein (TIGR00288 family)
MKVTEGKTNEPKTLVSIYGDYQNVKLSPTQANYLVSYASTLGCLVSKKVYANWLIENKVFAQALCRLGFDCLHVPLKDKNSVDHKLIDDCKSEVLNNPSLKIVILLSKDKDFVKLVRELQAEGKKVIVVAQTQVSKRLKKIADEFHHIDELAELVVDKR